MTSKVLVLVKHALPVLDPARPAREWRLGAEGELQAKHLGRHLRAFAPLRLVVSVEPKASRTGEIVAAELGIPMSVVEGLEEYDRPVLPILSRAAHERENAAIFTDLDRRVLGAETGRQARERFSGAARAELARCGERNLVIVTHGTVISLFVGAHNPVDAFELWKSLECPSYVVLEPRSFSLVEVVMVAA